MANKLQLLLMRIAPYIGIGVFLVVCVLALLIFSYILLIGGIIGLILFLIAYIKTRFFPGKKVDVFKPDKTGKTYEHRKD
jgi:hypothetical protein